MKTRKKKGFTLVELLVVIAIIGILFVVLISKVDFATDKAKETGVKTDFRSYQMAAETILREEGKFKTTAADFVPQLDKNIDARLGVKKVVADTATPGTNEIKAVDAKKIKGNESAADGNVITDALDPWGTAYKITFEADTLTVTSYGPDEKTGKETVDSKEVDRTADNLVLTVKITNGQISSTTTGFSNDLK